jgi:adenylosuccinate lyase
MNVLGGTAVFMRALVERRIAALRNARAQRDLGASAIELAIITALIAVAAGILAAVIVGVIDKKIPIIRGL